MRRAESGTRVAEELSREARSGGLPLEDFFQSQPAGLVMATFSAMALWTSLAGTVGAGTTEAAEEEQPPAASAPALLWRHTGPSDAPVGPAVLAGGFVVWATPRSVHAVRVTDGLPAWPASDEPNPPGGPAAGGPVSWRQGAVVGVDLFDRPSREGRSEAIAFAAGLATGQGRVYARIGPPAAARTHAVWGRLLAAIDAGPAEGRIEWVVEPPAGYDRFASVPVPHLDRILVAVARGRLALASLHASDGRLEWCVELPFPEGAPNRRECWLDAAAERVVVATTEGIAVLHLDGRIAWTRKRDPAVETLSEPLVPGDLPGGMADTRGHLLGPPRLLGDRLVMPAAKRGSLTCLAIEDGRVLWHCPADTAEGREPRPAEAFTGPGQAGGSTGDGQMLLIETAMPRVLLAGDGLTACRLSDGSIIGRFGTGRYRPAGMGAVSGNVFYWPARDDRRAEPGNLSGAGGVILPIDIDSLALAARPVATDGRSSSLVALGGFADGSIPAVLIRSSDSVVEAFLPPPVEAHP